MRKKKSEKKAIDGRPQTVTGIFLHKNRGREREVYLSIKKQLTTERRGGRREY